jgi:hypothetical protein
VAAVTAVVTVVVTADVTPAASAGGTHGAAPQGAPVKIDSVTVMRTAVQAGTYLFRQPVLLSQQDLASLNRLQDGTPGYDAWFRSRGGVDPSPSSIQLVVEGNASQAAHITDIALIKNCHPPLTGTLFLSPTAGENGSILLNFNLDSARTLAQAPNGLDYFANFTISLKPGEVQVLQVNVNTSHYYCQFTMQMTVLVGSRQTVETITNAGQPFRVSALAATKDYHALYVGGVATPHGYPAGDFVPENPATYQG